MKWETYAQQKTFYKLKVTKVTYCKNSFEKSLAMCSDSVCELPITITCDYFASHFDVLYPLEVREV